jgi:arylsulfatase A-like enzyme
MSSKKYNIILLTIDCWRADYLFANGNTSLPTPFLNRLASEVVNFSQAITCGGWTRPSMTALFSSTHASMYNGPLGIYASERPMLSESLRKAGYLTAGFTTNPQIGSLYGFDRGFDDFFNCDPDGTLQSPHWAKFKGAQRLLQQPFTHLFMNKFRLQSLPSEVTMPADQLLQKVSSWIGVTPKEPFFVWAHLMDAHWPYHVFHHTYSAPEKALCWRDINLMSQVAKQHGMLNPGHQQINRIKNLYHQALRHVDLAIEQLVNDLKAKGLWDQTILIITSDHGEEFYEHGRWGHYQLYEESVRVPLIIKLPWQSPSKEISHQVSLLDVAPTILSLVGVKKPDEMLGFDLLAYLKNGRPRGRVVFCESMWPDNYRLAIRMEDYKYLYESKLGQQCQLFHLESDPNELSNIVDKEPEVAGKFENLRIEIEALARSTSSSTSQKVDMAPEVIERLKALGYLQ